VEEYTMNRPRKARKLPTFLTEAELRQFYTVFNMKDPIDLRNFAIVRLMADAGLRISEALHLRVVDVDLESGRLFVLEGKGKVDRYVYLGKDDCVLLKRVLKQKRDSSKYLFTTATGNPLHPSYFRSAIKRYNEDAAVNKNVHPHTFRHTFATHLYKKTKDIRLVQVALAHSDLSTTMIYTHVEDDRLEAAMKALRD
jgi:site-specific recombinase XerD